MFTSVQFGLNGLNAPVFIHPADIAGVGASVYQTLAKATDTFQDDLVFRPVYQGRAGHPILLMPQAVKVAQQASPDANLRDVLRSVTPQRDIPVDDELILYDFDTRSEFQALEERISADS
jgi:CTP:molybdopterin cytidylyltransferase MocA